MTSTNKGKAAPSKPQPAGRKPRSVSDFVNAWIGGNPAALCPGVESKDIPSKKVDDLLGESIVIHGFSKRNGSYGDFDLILCSNDDDGKDVFVVSCGGAIIRRKLDTIGEASGFPVRASIVQPEGKQYYDLI